MRLTTNPPDSVKRFTIKKSIIGALDNAMNQPTINNSIAIAPSSTTSNRSYRGSSRNKSSMGFGLKIAVNAVK